MCLDSDWGQFVSIRLFAGFVWPAASVMDKYVKVKKIGEGSFGVAYLARYKEGNDRGKQVVLKEINMTKVSWFFGIYDTVYYVV